MYEIKTEDVYEDFSKDKKYSIFGIILESKYHDASSKLLIGKMEGETDDDVAIKEFVGFRDSF